MKFLKRFNEELIQKIEIVEMLENINDILDSYRDDYSIRLSIANPENLKLKQQRGGVPFTILKNVKDSIFNSQIFDYNYHSEIKILIFFEKIIFSHAPDSQNAIKCVNELLNRLNEEYPNTFKLFDDFSIESNNIKYK